MGEGGGIGEFRGGRGGGLVVMATLSCRIVLTAAGVTKV